MSIIIINGEMFNILVALKSMSEIFFALISILMIATLTPVQLFCGEKQDPGVCLASVH